MRTHSAASPLPRTSTAPGRHHPVAGAAAWSLGIAAMALTTGLASQGLFAAAVGWPAYTASAATVLIGGPAAVVAGVLWLLVLVPLVPLHRDAAVTRTAYWSAVLVGVAAGVVLFAPAP